MTNTAAAFSLYDWLVFSAVLAVSVGIGLYHAFCGGRQKTSKEYLLADKSMGYFPVALSLLASLFTGIYVQGITADVYYRGGTVQIWGMVSQTIALWIGARCFLPIFYKLRLTSVFEYIGMRFNRTVQISVLVIYFVFTLIQASIATFAMSLTLTAVTDMKLVDSILILSAACLVYTCMGGMKAVLWADCFQMFIVIGSMISIFIKSSVTLGGAKEVWRIGHEGKRIDFFNAFTWDPAEYATFWNVCFGGILSWLPAMSISQHQVQRFLSCKDMRTGNIALFLYGCGMAFMTAACVLGGVFLYAYFAYCDPLYAEYIDFSDELLPYFFVDSFVHIPGLAGLLVAGLCSLGLSTVSSVLSALAAVTCTHFVKPLMKSDNETLYVWIAKCLVVFYSVLIVGGAFVVETLGSIFAALVGFVGVVNGPIVGIFILGIFSPRINSKGATLGLFVALGIGLWILIGSLIYPYPPVFLPLSIEGCPVDAVTSNVTTSITPTATTMMTTTLGIMTTDPSNNWPPITRLYALSKLWYPTVTIVSVVVFGLLGSALTGFNDPDDINPDLICQLPQACCFWLPRRWRKWENEKEFTLEHDIKNVDDFEYTGAENVLCVEMRDVGTSTY